ncbi:MAG: uroporphyrinogen-III C-methyltransferase [Thiolinea sp.]
MAGGGSSLSVAAGRSRTQTGRKPSGRAQCLRAADQQLALLGDTVYQPVRQQIARDLAALEAVQMPDVVALSQLLDELLAQLEPLTLLPAETVSTATAPDSADQGADGGSNASEQPAPTVTPNDSESQAAQRPEPAFRRAG